MSWGMIARSDAIMAGHHELSTERLGEDDRMRLGVKWGHSGNPVVTFVRSLASAT